MPLLRSQMSHPFHSGSTSLGRLHEFSDCYLGHVRQTGRLAHETNEEGRLVRILHGENVYTSNIHIPAPNTRFRPGLAEVKQTLRNAVRGQFQQEI